MKLLPEVPTKELLDAIAYGQPISASHDDIYRAMYAAAPEVKDEPVAFARMYDGEVMVKGVSVFADTAQRELDRLNAEYPDDADRREIVPLYRCPPEVEALKAEIERLRNLLNEAALHLQACKDRGT